ncbi:MAG: hypothetical protein PHR77_11685 [Kiritimatiellae bacterium]|nr:hypothetical protein [Kiritimatiellia bacterium]MDD5521162.1 hypothetical protein [Kiritimatiellia bacterium]
MKTMFLLHSKNITAGVITMLLLSVLMSIKAAPVVQQPGDIVLENREFRLLITGKGFAKSLIHKRTGQECLEPDAQLPMFTLTQYRPYDGEVQLAFPCKLKTFSSKEVKREGDRLLVDFELIDHRMEIRIKETDSYIGFQLEKVRSKGIPNHWVQWKKTPSPIDEACFIQLPIKDRTNFGEWINAMWDKDVAVNLLATDPYPMIDGLERRGHHILHATATMEVKLEGLGAALIVTDGDKLLDRIGVVENDYGLPRGVESRRRKEYTYSYYWVSDVNPKNIDKQIEYAKRGGFKTFMIYYPAFAKAPGHYEFRENYPRGMADLQDIVKKIKQAGMIPGLHHHYNKTFGMDPYITPIPDPRLNLKKIFTLAGDIGEKGESIEVEENPEWSDLVSCEKYLRIDDELIQYDSFTITRPYVFTGCKRGIFKTKPAAHRRGEKFGLLGEVAGVIGVYDPKTSIQAEVAERLGKLYTEAGFEFAYFDGAEDVPPPYWFTTSHSQWLVWKAMEPRPMFAEGACKSHFSWHILSRGNAFDIFLPELIKNATRAYAGEEAPRVAKDFTGLNFGWIGYWNPTAKTIGTQPDMLEYVTSRAAAWNSPVSFRGNLREFEKHPRTADNLEVLKRWEDVRVKQWLKSDDKEKMKDWDREHILLVDESGQYELQEYEQIKGAAGGDAKVRAFIFERKGTPWVVYWHPTGEGKLEAPVSTGKFELFQELAGGVQRVEVQAGKATFPLNDRRYIKCEGLKRTEVVRLFEQAKVL